MPPPRPTASFSLDAPRLVGGLVFGMLWLEVLVVVLDLGLHHGGLIGPDLGGWFDAASENGLGSWVAITQTGLLALTAWGVVAVARATGAGRRRVLGWAVLAAGFSLMALDDGTMLHERVGSAFADTEASLSGLGGAFPSYYWQLVLGPVFGAFGLFLAVFLWRELGAAGPRWRVGGALALLAVAVGLDFMDGLGDLHAGNLPVRVALALDLGAFTEPVLDLSPAYAATHASQAVEESLEMAAMTLLWAALLGHLAATVGGVTLRWAPAAAPVAAPLPEAGGDGAAWAQRASSPEPGRTIPYLPAAEDGLREAETRTTVAQGTGSFHMEGLAAPGLLAGAAAERLQANGFPLAPESP